MTQVSFYVIDPSSRFAVDGGVFVLAASLCEKALAARQHEPTSSKPIVVFAPSDKLSEVDDVFWTYNPSSFLVHEVVHEVMDAFDDGNCGKYAPIILTDQPLASIHEPADVVFNLTDDVIGGALDALSGKQGQMAQPVANRIIEIVAADETSKAQGRVRYKAYKQLGLDVQYVNVAAKKSA